jgi:hypothetical protein
MLGTLSPAQLLALQEASVGTGKSPGLCAFVLA